jgi:hypothetical protein
MSHVLQEGEIVDDTKVLKAFFKQRLSANCKSLVIADIGLLQSNLFAVFAD